MNAQAGMRDWVTCHSSSSRSSLRQPLLSTRGPESRKTLLRNKQRNTLHSLPWEREARTPSLAKGIRSREERDCESSSIIGELWVSPEILATHVTSDSRTRHSTAFSSFLSFFTVKRRSAANCNEAQITDSKRRSKQKKTCTYTYAVSSDSSLVRRRRRDDDALATVEPRKRSYSCLLLAGDPLALAASRGWSVRRLHPRSYRGKL